MWMKEDSPLYAVIKMAMVILGAELSIMFLIDGVFIPFFGSAVPPWFWEFLDPITLTIVVAPVLNGLVLQPMRRQQLKLEHQKDELRIASVAFESQNGIVITDTAGIILRVNPAYVRLTGYSAEESIGKSTSMLKSGRQGPQFYVEFWASLKKNGRWQGEIWNRRKNGKIYAEMLNITAVVSPERGVTHYVGSFSDITENKEAEAEIHRLAYYDVLTKLPNRRLLQDRIGQALAATSRSGLFGAIFLIDLDHFKELNDSRGHEIGDQLLLEVAQRLRNKIREVDTVARQGGDEFVILMEDLSTDKNDAIALTKLLAQKLNEAFELPFKLGDYEYYCKFSIGVSLFHKQDTVEDLLKHADLALYHAKNSGRNTLRFFDPAMQAALDLRNALEAELRHALRLNQLVLFYQPQVDANLRVHGVEALLRWQNPERGMISPMDFIPIAEATGLILQIGHWVLETACAQLKDWENNVMTHLLEIAVNVSARQFRQHDFVTQVQSALNSSGANPANLKLELTETLALEDVDDTVKKMLSIKQLGVNFSMDDFGTGYSSLSYLAKLPLNQLKIDKAFVKNLPGNINDEAVVRAIITLGHELAMNVIAEGVETREQQEFLETHGCHAFQGFLFSKPLPISELELFLQREPV